MWKNYRTESDKLIHKKPQCKFLTQFTVTKKLYYIIGIPKALKFTGCQFKTIVFPACEERKKYPEE